MSWLLLIVIFLTILLVISSCARPIYKFQDGTLVKTQRDRPTKTYAIAFGIGFGLGEQYKRTKQ